MFLFIILCIVIAILLGGAYYAYRVAFFSPLKGRGEVKPITNPNYDPYREEMRRIYRILKDRPFDTVTVTSFDGLTLSGRYYHVKDGAPLDIGFHGYHSSPVVDFSGGSELSFEFQHNLLLVDQRAHGNSEGRTICFGLKERYDLVTWVNYAINRFGKDTQILLYGVSMGATTVLMASGLDLPHNVKGIVADCPFANPMEIIQHVGNDMPIPNWLIRPFVILGARIFGGFDVTETDAVEAVKHTNVPILIIHGEADGFVPCSMSAAVEQANPKMVQRHTIPGAEHGISYLVDRNTYRQLVTEFTKKVLN